MKIIAILAVVSLFVLNTTPVFAQTPTPEPVGTVTVPQESTGQNSNIPFFSQLVEASYSILQASKDSQGNSFADGTSLNIFYVFWWLVLSLLISLGIALYFKQLFLFTFVAIFMLSLGYVFDILDLWIPVISAIILFALTTIASRRVGF